MVATEQIAGIKKADRSCRFRGMEEVTTRSQVKGYQKGEICSQVLLIHIMNGEVRTLDVTTLNS